VEADIYLVAGRLLVAHDLKDVKPERTLEKLYLQPLQERVRQQGGRVFGNGPPFTLLVDIKGDADATWRVLRETLQPYARMLTRFSPERTETGAVTVILSGNRPRALLEAEKSRLAGIDGRLDDLGKGVSPHLMPLVSDNWTRHFTWRGEGPIPEGEWTRLRETVKRAHAEGYRLRFWATPDKPGAWRELRDAGVDLINTDDLSGLRLFLLQDQQ